MAWIDEFIYKWRANSYKGRGKARSEKNPMFPFSFNSDLFDELEELLEELTGGFTQQFDHNTRSDRDRSYRSKTNSKQGKRKTNARSRKIMDMMMEEAIEKMRKR